MTKQTLFILWSILFALCAGLGFLPETGVLTTAAALLFFVPPAVLLYRAKQVGDDHTRLLIRNLSALSLGLTVALLVANFLVKSQRLPHILCDSLYVTLCFLL